VNLLPSHRGRSTAGIAISVILHSLAAIAAVRAIAAAAAAPHPKIGRPAFVLTFLGAPPVVPALPARLLRVPEAARARPPDISTPLSTPTPPAVTPAPETAGVEPKPAIPPAPPRSDPPPNSAPPRPSLAPITVGLFAGATNNSQNSAPGRRVVESAGFDAAPARAPETNLVAAT